MRKHGKMILERSRIVENAIAESRFRLRCGQPGNPNEIRTEKDFEDFLKAIRC